VLRKFEDDLSIQKQIGGKENEKSTLRIYPEYATLSNLAKCSKQDSKKIKNFWGYLVLLFVLVSEKKSPGGFI